jgi:hypothetical protein
LKALRDDAVVMAKELGLEVDDDQSDLGVGREGSTRPAPVREDVGAQINAAARTVTAIRRGRVTLWDVIGNA